jgi:hypothetical protein
MPCTVHQRYRLPAAGPLARGTPGICEQVFEVYPAMYYDWMQAQGLPLPPAGAELVQSGVFETGGFDTGSSFPDPQPPTSDPRLCILFPDRNSVFKLDPELDPSFQSVQLRAEVPAGCAEVSWRIDGALFTTSAYPFSCFWPLAPGRHRIACEAGRFSDEVPVLVLN